MHQSTPSRILAFMRQLVLLKCNNSALIGPQAPAWIFNVQAKNSLGSNLAQDRWAFHQPSQFLFLFSSNVKKSWHAIENNNLLFSIEVQVFLEQQKTKGIVQKDFNSDWIFFGLPGLFTRIESVFFKGFKGFCVCRVDDTWVQSQVFLLLWQSTLSWRWPIRRSGKLCKLLVLQRGEDK